MQNLAGPRSAGRAVFLYPRVVEFRDCRARGNLPCRARRFAFFREVEREGGRQHLQLPWGPRRTRIVDAAISSEGSSVDLQKHQIDTRTEHVAVRQAGSSE